MDKYHVRSLVGDGAHANEARSVQRMGSPKGIRRFDGAIFRGKTPEKPPALRDLAGSMVGSVNFVMW